jgi:hypothetical protein
MKGSRLSRIIQNSVAVHHAAQVIRRSHYTVQQNNVRSRLISPQRLAEVIEEVVAASVTVEDFNQLAEIAESAEQQGLDTGQVEARIRETTPFAGLVRLLPKTRSELYAFLSLLVAILALLRPSPTQGLTPEQVEHPSTTTTTPPPACDDLPATR